MLLSNHQKTLEPYFKFTLPDAKLMSQLSDKRGQYFLVAKHDIPRPISFFPETQYDAQVISRKISYPCALKPLKRHQLPGYRKLWVVHSPAELIATFQKLQLLNVDVMVTELIPGGDDQIFSYYTYMNACSQPLCHFTKQKLRQLPIRYGIGTVHLSVWEPRVAELGLRLLQDLGYQGIGYVEFKRDERDDKLKFIEINTRTGLPLELLIASGIDIPWIAYQDALGEAITPLAIQSHQREGVKWVCADWDLQSFWGYWSRGEISIRTWLKSLRGERVYAYYSTSDPLPFVMATLGFGRMIGKRLFHRIIRSLRIWSKRTL
jgi:predicted ATP-grasp superfamily ATP-dependent carboligase